MVLHVYMHSLSQVSSLQSSTFFYVNKKGIQLNCSRVQCARAMARVSGNTISSGRIYAINSIGQRV